MFRTELEYYDIFPRYISAMNGVNGMSHFAPCFKNKWWLCVDQIADDHF